MLFVMHLFGRTLRLIKQGMRRIQRCQVFSFANVFCGSSFCNWTPISALHKHLKKTHQKHITNVSNISKTQNKHLKHLKLCNKGISYVYFMIKLTLKSAVTHSRDIDLTRIVCIYNHHYQHLNVTECQCV